MSGSLEIATDVALRWCHRCRHLMATDALALKLTEASSMRASQFPVRKVLFIVGLFALLVFSNEESNLLLKLWQLGRAFGEHPKPSSERMVGARGLADVVE